MTDLVPVRSPEDILPEYRGTPIGDFLGYHNLGHAWRAYDRAELLVGMCMDNRKVLRIPDNFAYVLRAGGANLRRIEFKVAFAVAIGGVRSVCLIAHDECGMVDLRKRRDDFIAGLERNGGWERGAAGRYFDEHAAEFEIGDAAMFVVEEARRLRERYPGIRVAPLFYKVGDGLLYQVLEGK